MRTLLLLRHAKSSWDDPSLADLDRPLAPRGRKAAPAMAKFMVKKRWVPDLVLSSPAERVRETWQLMAPVLGEGIPT
ncbi:MAG: histidine phosphatase family protein, partial [Pseudomonadota bacterium]